MPRVDAWDVKTQPDADVSVGLSRGFADRFTFGQELGRGGFGVVRAVTDAHTGEQLACKTIVKRLAVPNLSAAKQQQHLEKIKRELEVMRRLRGSLNVAQLKGAFEDNTDVHIVMEWCRGGELWHRIGRAHYSERTVSSYMRAVLRTIAQCHSQRILHRDIKPGNFMLLSDSPKAPLKAIDFGLAVFFDPEALPRTDLGLEGTPWYMAPEVLNCEVGPPSDVWAAGVMCYQLLSGYLPFDDRKSPRSPAISKIYQAIFAEDPKVMGSAWADISDEAKDFVKKLLNKDPKQRPTAREALKHPWLHGGTTADRGEGAPLDKTVVQRLQRFSQGNLLKKTIFELIAAELLKAAAVPESLQDLEASEASESKRPTSAGSGHGMRHFREALSRMAQQGTDSSQNGSAQGPHSGQLLLPRPRSAPGGDNAGLDSLPEQLAHRESKEGRGDQDDDRGAGGTGGGGTGAGTAGSTGRSGGGAGSVEQQDAERNDRAAHHRRLFEEAQARLGHTAGGSAHAGMEFYRPIEGYPGATTSLGRHTANGGATPAQQVSGHKRPSSVHGGRSYFRGPALGPLAGASRFRLMRAAAAAGRLSADGECSWGDYVHVAPRTDTERREQRKAARLALDTASASALASRSSPNLAALASPRSAAILRGASDPGVGAGLGPRRSRSSSGGRAGGSGTMDVDLESFPEVPRDRGKPHAQRAQPTALQASAPRALAPRRSLSATHPAAAAEPPTLPQVSGAAEPELEGVGRRGNAGLYKAFLEREQAGRRGSADLDPQAGGAAGRSSSDASRGGRGHSSAPDLMDIDGVSAQQQEDQQQQREPGGGGGNASGSGHTAGGPGSVGSPPSNGETSGRASGERHVRFTEEAEAHAAKDDDSSHRSNASSGEGSFHRRELDAAFAGSSFPQEVRDLMRRLRFSRHEEGVAVEQLGEGLAQLGYALEPTEVARLLEQMQQDDGFVGKSGFLASQIDWTAFQVDFREQWLQAAKRAFDEIERKGGTGVSTAGTVRSSHLIDLLRTRLPGNEVEYAVEDALLEAGAVDADEIDFDGFLRMLRVGSVDHLDQYESRHQSSASQHGGAHFGDLSTVAE